MINQYSNWIALARRELLLIRSPVVCVGSPKTACKRLRSSMVGILSMVVGLYKPCPDQLISANLLSKEALSAFVTLRSTGSSDWAKAEPNEIRVRSEERRVGTEAGRTW